MGVISIIGVILGDAELTHMIMKVFKDHLIPTGTRKRNLIVMTGDEQNNP